MNYLTLVVVHVTKINQFALFVSLLYVHNQQLRSCRMVSNPNQTVPGQASEADYQHLVHISVILTMLIFN